VRSLIGVRSESDRTQRNSLGLHIVIIVSDSGLHVVLSELRSDSVQESDRSPKESDRTALES
jgi:hypothetical protein